MAKRVPKYIIQNIQRTNELMQKIVDMNYELEAWIQKQGIENGSDFTFDYRESRGYEIYDVEGLIARIEEKINE